jgi:predicted nucleic acid-binding protein
VIDYVPLDAGVVGLLCSSPLLLEVAECKSWLAGLRLAGTTIVISDLTRYEVRRELVRIGAARKLARLDNLLSSVRTADVTTDAWLKAAEFWAFVRKAGKPTADPHALDGDAILAGVAATIGTAGDSVTIATTNVGHLARFPGVDARRWETIS